MENYGPWHNTYLAIYFTLTGLHALHVIGGALVIGYIWGPGAGMWKTDPERYTNRIEVSGLFWHFVDLVWIFLFPVLYPPLIKFMSHNHSHGPGASHSHDDHDVSSPCGFTCTSSARCWWARV